MIMNFSFFFKLLSISLYNLYIYIFHKMVFIKLFVVRRILSVIAFAFIVYVLAFMIVYGLSHIRFAQIGALCFYALSFIHLAFIVYELCLCHEKLEIRATVPCGHLPLSPHKPISSVY